MAARPLPAGSVDHRYRYPNDEKQQALVMWARSDLSDSTLQPDSERVNFLKQACRFKNLGECQSWSQGPLGSR